MKKLSADNQGALFATSSGLLYGLVGYFGMNLLNSNISVTNMTFWRFLVATLFIALLLIRQYKNININKQEMLKAFLSGASFYSLSTVFYFMASQYIGTGLAMVILFTFPVFVIFLNWILFRMKIPKIYYFAILITTFGMLLLADLGELKFDLIGFGLGVISAFLYACYIVSSKNIKLPPLVSTLMISLGCAMACLLFAIFDNSLMIPSIPTQWIHILGFGIFSTAFSILFLLKALTTLSAEKASILSVLEPVFVVIFGIFLLDEKITTIQIGGVIIILAGAMITLFSNKLRSFSLLGEIFSRFWITRFKKNMIEQGNKS